MSNLPASTDVVVVGSGICGAAAAAAAAARGLKVLLVDKEAGPAAEASGQAQGVLRLQGREPVELPLAQEALALWHAADEVDHELEIVFGGNLYFARHEGELGELGDLVSEAHRAGLYDVQLLEPEAVRELVPAARGPFAGAMWSPRDGHCDPRQATEHFTRRARRHGVLMVYGQKVTRILERGGRVVGVQLGTTTTACEHVIVAAGVWTPHLVATVGIRVALMPVALTEGETSCLPELFRSAVRAVGFGGRQRPDGRIVFSAGLNARVTHGLSLSDALDMPAWLARLVAHRTNVGLSVDWPLIGSQLRHRSLLGTQTVPVGVATRTDAAQVRAAHQAMSRVFPDVAAARIERMWAGRIDMSLDGLPVIDGSAGPEGLIFVTGLSGHGLMLGPVIGEIAADLVTTGTTSRPIHPFRLSRFREEAVAIPRKTI